MSETTEKIDLVVPTERRQSTAASLNSVENLENREQRSKNSTPSTLEALSSLPLLNEISRKQPTTASDLPNLKVVGQIHTDGADAAIGEANDTTILHRQDSKRDGTTQEKPSLDIEIISKSVDVPGNASNDGESVDRSDINGTKSQFKIVEPQTEIMAKGGETLESLTLAESRNFLGDSYAQFESDNFLLQQFVESYKKSLATINGVDQTIQFKAGEIILLPGKSGEGEPIFEKDGKITSWALDSVSTRETDGTERLDWYNGSYSIKRPDGVTEARDQNGLKSTSRKMDDGSWLTERSDGSSERRNYDTGDLETRSKDGITTKTKNDVITTTYPDSSENVKNPDGSSVYTLADKSVERTTPDGQSKRFDKNGNLIGQGTGFGRFKVEFQTDDGTTTSTVSSESRSEFRFILIENGNKIQLQEKDSGDRLEFVSTKDYEPVKPERDKLLEMASAQISDPLLLAKFKADMIRFENRSKERELPAEQVRATYKSVGQLLGDNSNPAVEKTRLTQVATEIMSDVAEPYTVSQGRHGTCNVKIMHVLMAAKAPEKLAGMISEIALTGSLTLPSGDKVELPPKTLNPATDAETNPRSNGERGLAGQLFDSAVINAVMKDAKAPFHLDQLAKDPSLKGYKTGDILVDNETGKPLIDFNGEVQEFAGLYSKDIVKAYSMVMGDAEAGSHWLLDPNISEADHPGIKGFESADQLHDILSELAKRKSFPIAIIIDTRMPPFWGDSGAGVAGGSGSAHVLNITNYDPQSRTVMLDNQWSTNRDRLLPANGIPVDQLFRSSIYNQTLVKKINEDIIRKSGGEAGALESNIQRLTQLSRALDGGDPTLLENLYKAESQKFGIEMSTTSDGDQKNKEYRALYDGLRPLAKLEVLGSLASRNAVGRTMSAESFNEEISKIADSFEVTEPDVFRQMKHNPQTLVDGKAAKILFDLSSDKEYMNRGKMEVLNLIARLPGEQRDSITRKIRENVQTKIARTKATSTLAQ